MALPPWTVELLRRGVADLARQVTDNDTAASLKEQASKLVDELPKAAREKVESLLKQAEASARPLKDAWQNNPLWGGGPISLTPTRLINGTGRLLDPRGSGVGLPAETLAAAIPLLSGDAARQADLESQLCDQIAVNIAHRCEHGGVGQHALAAIVTNSMDASLALIATLGQRGGGLWVPRCCAVPMPSHDAGKNNLLVERLRRYALGPVREFGLAAGDQQWPSELFSEEHRVLVRLGGTQPSIPIPTEQRDDWTEVVVLPLGSIFSLGDASSVPSVIEQLNGGADVVVLAGGVLSATPELSLIVGRQREIERLRRTPQHALVAAPLAMTSIVASSVALQTSGRSPIQQLAGVAPENLQDRAERLATQFAACEWVAATRVTESTASIGAASAHDAEPTYPSRQVVVALAPTHDAESICQRLATASTGLLCRVENQELVIDLRWISPEQQAQISELAASV